MYYGFAGAEKFGEGIGIHEIVHDVADAMKWLDKWSPGRGDDGDIPRVEGFNQVSANEASGAEHKYFLAVRQGAHPSNSS
jgi:hypothetical protein